MSMAQRDGWIWFDGEMVPCRTALDRVEISMGEHDVCLMKLDGRDFYSTLGSTFLGV